MCIDTYSLIIGEMINLLCSSIRNGDIVTDSNPRKKVIPNIVVGYETGVESK